MASDARILPWATVEGCPVCACAGCPLRARPRLRARVPQRVSLSEAELRPAQPSWSRASRGAWHQAGVM